MTKERAREILSNFFTKEAMCYSTCAFPITDEVICTISSPQPKIATTLQEQEELNERAHVIEQWSFKGLIKIAYDLEDKKL